MRGGRSRPAFVRLFRRDGVRLGFRGIGCRRIAGAVVVALGEERWESRRTGFTFAIGLGRVNVGHGRGELVALDAATGKRLWVDRLPRPDFGCATVARGVVFTSTFDGVLIGVDARNGRRIFVRRLTAGINACPAVAGDMLVVAAGVRLEKDDVLQVYAFSTS